MINKRKLNKVIDDLVNGDGVLKLKDNNMADTDKRIEDAQKKVDEANQKVADARPGYVVSHISSQGTPSTYEDARHPDGKAIAQLDDETRTQDLDKYESDKESLAKAVEERADEEVANAEAAVANAQSEAGNVDSKPSKEDK